MTLRIGSLMVLALAAGSASACGKKKEVAPPPAPATAPASTPVVTPPPAPAPRNTAPTTDPNAEAKAREAAIATLKSSLTQTIYFEYDKSDIIASAMAILDAKVRVLRGNPAVRLRINGHTDERGSNEYNMALGQKRAAAARKYMEGQGIDVNRIDVVSSGEERPAIGGEGEESWSKNRRDEFEIVAGADQIRPPGA